MLHVHRAARADHLAAELASVLAVAPPDPFAPEVVAVHSRGIERWLAQQLSGQLGTSGGPDQGADGVCANVRFPFPGGVIGPAVATAVEVDPVTDPWLPDRLVWPLLELLRAPPDDLELGPLAPLVDTDARFGAARRVVDLFDRYAVHRPAMVRAWAQGDEVAADGARLTSEHVWQASVWRALRTAVGTDSPAERHTRALERLSAGDVELDLPQRLGLFGLTALPASHLEVLAAIARHREVRLYLLHPSPALWDAVAQKLRDATPAAPTPLTSQVPARAQDPTREVAAHPLLRSWGRDAREIQLVLDSVSPRARGASVAPRARGGPVSPRARGASVAPRTGSDSPTSLLARLQDDVRGDRRPPGVPLGGADDERGVLGTDDRSVQIHGAHGRTRQVEVLRDAIAHLLAADHALEPRDIVVCCPDVERFAPLIHAVFGAPAAHAETDDLGSLRVRLADRSLRATNPLLEVLAELLELADGRIEASRVLDLAARAPVRRRFGFDDDDLSRLETWVDELGVRWGLDVDHRARHELPGVEANTWRAGLDRLLIGAAVADEELRTVGGVVPYDDVEGADLDRAGRIAELVDRLDAVVTELTRPQPVDAWRESLLEAIDALTATPEGDGWQRAQLARLLDDVVRASGDDVVRASGDDVVRASGDDEVTPVPLALGEMRALLADELRGRPSRANHRTGDLTVCTLVPMRSVPHRVVCLLGMDDEAFPRRVTADGDDLVDLSPRVGDRDARTEDRQLLLDALLAATETLVVTYTARDERTNQQRPPAVPVGELLDVIDATVRPASDTEGRNDVGGRARDRVVVSHPLQPFDRVNFRAGALGVSGPWSFDTSARSGARRLAARRAAETGDDAGARAPFIAALEPLDEPVIDLAELLAFFGHPVRSFLTRRLGVRVPRSTEERDDAIPIELSPLATYGLGDRLLAARRAGLDPQRWELLERARGTLPPGELADRTLADAHASVDALLTALADTVGVAADPSDEGSDAGRPVTIEATLPDGRTLRGSVPGVVGETITAARYAKLSAKHQLNAWVQLLALTLARPEVPWSALAIGRNPKKAKALAAWCRLGPLGDDAGSRHDAAGHELTRLLTLYDQGLREPLPLFAKTSARYAEEMARSKRDRFAAASVWDSEWGFPENADGEHALVHGAGSSYEDVLLIPPTDDERGEGWPDADSRFEVLALAVWEPLHACRQEGTA